jgi:hypothetical protein
MADADGPLQYFRRWGRRQYLTRYERERRARAKSEGARRVDVTLDAQALDDYATVLAYLKGMNRLMAGLSRPLPPYRLSATVIRMALRRAASDILEEDDETAKSGGRRILDV